MRGGPGRPRVVVPRLVAPLLAGLLLAAGCGGPEPVTDDRGGTLLTEAGLAHVERTHAARLDLSGLRLTREQTGLDPDLPARPRARTTDGRPVRLALVGPEGTTTVPATGLEVSFVGEADRAAAVRWTERSPTRAAATAALLAAVRTWGLRREDVAGWSETVVNSRDASARQLVGAAVSPSGLVVEVTGVVSSTGRQTHEWRVVLDPDAYRPAALDVVRRTGRLPADVG